MNIIIGCEVSGAMRDAFCALGHNAWSCDFATIHDIPATYTRRRTHDERHIVGDIRDNLYGPPNGGRWHMGIFHTPCTNITNTGSRWLYTGGKRINDKHGNAINKKPARWAAMKRDVGLFLECFYADIPLIASENPIPVGYAGLPEPTQIVQPWMFGTPEFKATCWWLKGLPPLLPTGLLIPPVRKIDPEKHAEWSKVHRWPKGPDREFYRSLVAPGMVAACAIQWGALVGGFCRACGASIPNRFGEGRCPRCGHHAKVQS